MTKSWQMSDLEKIRPSLSNQSKREWLATANASLQKSISSGFKNGESNAMREADLAVKNLGGPKTSSISGEFFAAGIAEKATNENTKRELMVTLLREGPGNKYHNNYYKKSALETAGKELQSRKKQYYDHAANVDNAERSIKDWASSIIETMIEIGADGKAILKGRVKVLDEWLWQRAQHAPEELAVSIEGKGVGKSEVIEGQEYNAIYEIQRVNGVNWVDYPGNAGMGVEILEKDKTKEEMTMDFTALMESLKTLSDEQKHQLAEGLNLKPVSEGSASAEVSALKSMVEKLQIDAQAQAKELKEKLDAVEKEKTAMLNKVEAHEIKSKEREKVSLVEKLLKDSKLQEQHKTETFYSVLMSVKEYKAGDKTISEEEQMKQLIEDREKICIAESAKPKQDGDGNGGKSIEVAEQHRLFSVNIFGIDPTATPKATPNDAAPEGKK